MTLVDASVTPGSNTPTGTGEKTGPPQALRNDREAALVVKRWREGGEELIHKRREWWQNLSFHLGEQWVWWDRRRNKLQTLPQQWSPLGPGRAKIVVNKVRPSMRGLLARLMRNDLEFDVPPSSSSDDVMSASMLAGDILSASYHDLGWRRVRYDAIFAAFMGGTSAVAIDWNATKGVPLGVNDETGRVIGTGEVELTALNITEFCLEKGVREARHSRYWLQGLALPPSQVQNDYKIPWKPSPDAAGLMSPVQAKLLQSIGRPAGTNLCLVLIMFERPNPDQPKGRYRVVVNGVCVVSTPWPFPFEELNLEVFHQDEVQGAWAGSTLMNDAIGVQAAYNRIRSILQDHSSKAGNARVMSPNGSITEDQLTDGPGDLLEYAPDIGGAKPEYLSPPPLPSWLVTEATNLAAELDDIMHVHDTSRGEASFDRASGQALALLSEKDDSPLGLMAYEQADGWGQIASKVLRLYETKVTETREITIRPDAAGSGQPNETRVSRWNGKMLRGQTRVFVPLSSTFPWSQAARQALADNLWLNKVITDPVVYQKMLKLPIRELGAVTNADVARATRENVRMIQGEVQMPEHFDDHKVHIAEHNRMRKTDAYQYATQDVQSIFDDHVNAHANFAAEELAQQMAKASMNPALASAPQATEPDGSGVPPDFAEQQAGVASPQQADAIAKLAAAQGAGGSPAAGGNVTTPGPGAGGEQPLGDMGQSAPQGMPIGGAQ